MIRSLALAMALACTPDPVTGPGSTTNDTTTTAPPPTTSPTTSVPTTSPSFVLGLTAVLQQGYGTVVSVTWQQFVTADVHLEYSFDPGVWVSSPVVTRGKGEQRELLLGIPYESLVTWRLVATAADGTFTSSDAVITTANTPADLPDVTVTVSEPDKYDSVNAPYWLVGLAVNTWSQAPWWEVIVDRQGRPVWGKKVTNGQSSMHARVARDGLSLLIDHNTWWPGGAGESWIERILIDGTQLHVYQVPGMHHPWTDMPDGSIAYGDESTGEEHITIAYEDGSYESVWNCDDWTSSHGLGGCASNTLNYDEASNAFTFSHYSINTIFDVDRTTGEVNRYYGNSAGTYEFDPPQSQFWWQHGGHITPEGTLITSSHKASNDSTTVIHEYEIDDATQTLHEIWNYGLQDGIVSSVMGEAVDLPNTNVLHNLGDACRVREATRDGETVWDVQWDCGGLGRTMPIADLYALRQL